MPRLIRAERQLHGHTEEFWITVDEDEPVQWPACPGEVVGRPTARIDGFERATGRAIFTADVKLPGMLHAAVLRSPHARARVTRLDLSAALAMPGVHSAIGPGDLSFMSNDCSFEGVPIAAACADTSGQARAAIDAIKVEFNVLEPLLDADEAVRRGDLIAAPRIRERGDVEQGFAEADLVLEAEFRTHAVTHNSMETHQAVVDWVGGGVEVHISTQFIWGIREAVAAELGLPADKVRVICNYMGGGFGSKDTPDEYTFIAAELARRTGRPVKCALTRREANTAAGNRNATIQRLAIGARRDGTLTALRGDYVNLAGWGGWLTSTEGPMQRLYSCQHVKTTTKGAKLNLPPMKSFRAPGYCEGTFGLEVLLDELASELNLDALEIRRLNHADFDHMDNKPFSDKNLLECYRRAEPHWDRRHEVRARSTETVKRGVGLASQIWHAAGGPPGYAWVRVGADAHVVVITAMQDIGTGTKTAMAMIAAEELRVPLEHVSVSAGDSACGPYASLSGGSFTTATMGPAVRAAAADARRQIEDIARDYGMAGARIDEVLTKFKIPQILGKGSRGPNPSSMRVLTFGVQVAEVAVDIETAQVRVERIAAVHDFGRVVNPLGASSQIEGGIIQAIGHTLVEERLHDPRTGQQLTKTLDAYRLPTIADVPEIVSELIGKPDAQVTHLGSKGVGELSIIPTAAAIANAIRDATGARVRQLPITRDVMMRALREAREREKDSGGIQARD